MTRTLEDFYNDSKVNDNDRDLYSALSQGSKRFTTLFRGLCMTAFYRRILQPRSLQSYCNNSRIRKI